MLLSTEKSATMKDITQQTHYQVKKIFLMIKHSNTQKSVQLYINSTDKVQSFRFNCAGLARSAFTKKPHHLYFTAHVQKIVCIPLIQSIYNHTNIIPIIQSLCNPFTISYHHLNIFFFIVSPFGLYNEISKKHQVIFVS